MEIYYSSLRGLTTLLNKIKKECQLPVSHAISVKRLLKTIDTEVALYNEQYSELLSQYAKKDEDNKPLINPETKFIIFNDVIGFEKAMKELMDQTFLIDKLKLQVSDFYSMKMTMEEFDFLEMLIEEETLV